MLRVLMLARSDLLTIRGGDTTQALKTAEHVRRLGVEVDLQTAGVVEWDRYDLVHLFTASETSFRLVRLAHQHRKPVALSTIYWNQDELLRFRLPYGRAGWVTRILGADLAGLARRRLWYRQRAWRGIKASALEADLLLPNSRAEAELLHRDFGVPSDARVCQVVNGVDPAPLLNADPQAFARQFGIRDFILSVGRIEIRKNQLALLSVLRPDDPPLVLVGSPNPSEAAYVARVLELARTKNVRIIESIPHDQIASAYAAARVHAMPSWYETPGLASLEAALVDCPILTTDRGCTQEYFGSMAHYCDPGDCRSIRQGLDAVLGSDPRVDLKAHILSHFTWTETARQTVDAYQTLL